MAAEKVRSDPEQVKTIANKLRTQSAQVEVILSSIKGHYDELVGGGWIGVGSQKYKQEQESFTHPTLKRMIDKMATAATKVEQANKIIQDAGQEAARAMIQ